MDSFSKINRFFPALLLLFFLICLVPSCKRSGGGSDLLTEPLRDTVPLLGFLEDTLDVVGGTVREGETFTGLMSRLGMDNRAALELAFACDSVFDVRRMRAGNGIRAYYTRPRAADPDPGAGVSGSGAGESGAGAGGAGAGVPGNVSGTSGKDAGARAPRYVVYDNNLVDMTVFSCVPPYEVYRVSRQVDTVLCLSDIVIRSSLWVDMAAAGASPQLIVELSEIFAWTVDFFSLQEGDRFQTLYSQRMIDGEVVAVDSIRYALFERDTVRREAILFNAGEGRGRYWGPGGESLRKAFLKAPLKFTRISSGFSYARKHPVTGQIRPHTAVDYAAPKGTPVHSIGDGTVLSAGWAGGGGNTVKIAHNSVYTTSYMHLSSFAKGIKAGSRVSQGDVIGYVGATGTATGPHLDFRVYKNGTAINPLTMESPDVEPLPEELLPALDSVRRIFLTQVDSLSSIAPEPSL